MLSQQILNRAPKKPVLDSSGEFAEEQINQLEAEIALFRDRAVRAERWLQTIQKEIEEKLIAPRSVSSAEQTSLELPEAMRQRDYH